jgi:hypothetical protein
MFYLYFPDDDRNTEERGLSLVTRNAIPDELEEFKAKDSLPEWSTFHIALLSSEIIQQHSVAVA